MLQLFVDNVFFKVQVERACHNFLYMFSRELRRPLLLAFGLMGCLQFCGIYALITYSEPIFAAVLSSAENPNDRLATHLVAVVSATRLVTTAISIPFLDKVIIKEIQKN